MLSSSKPHPMQSWVSRADVIRDRSVGDVQKPSTIARCSFATISVSKREWTTLRALLRLEDPDLDTAEKGSTGHGHSGNLVVAGIAQVGHLQKWLESPVFMHHGDIPHRIGCLLEPL